MPTRLLLVDDEPDITSIFQRALAKYDFEVVSYNNAVNALADFKPGQYEIVLLDYKMPELDGHVLYEKLSIIDSRPKYIFLTAAEYMPDDILMKKEPGRVQFIRKPITVTELVRQVQRALSG